MPVRVADVGEQVEDLGLDRDVERGDRLVQDQHARLGGERAGDRDALALAAGQRPRQGGRSAGRRGRPASASSATRRRARRPGRARWSRSTSSIEAPAGLARVEAGCTGPGRRSAPRGRAAAARTPCGPACERSRPQARDRAGRRPLQPDEHARQRRLAGARLADDRQRPPSASVNDRSSTATISPSRRPGRAGGTPCAGDRLPGRRQPTDPASREMARSAPWTSSARRQRTRPAVQPAQRLRPGHAFRSSQCGHAVRERAARAGASNAEQRAAGYRGQSPAMGPSMSGPGGQQRGGVGVQRAGVQATRSPAPPRSGRRT